MPLTPQAIAPHIPAHQRICLALSGGVDSIVLLHLLASLRHSHPFTLSAVHVHHGLNPDADQWLDFCRDACVRLNVSFAAERVRVEPKGQGVEAAARAARYAVFAAQPCDAIALAHHQDDQIETFFLAALRGGGIRALAAMPPSRVWQGKTLLRPLLAYSRAEIEAYAAAHGLNYVHDSSNQDPSLLRNWLRHQMLPQLVFRLPDAAAHIQSTIATLQDEHALLNEIIAEDWQRIHAQHNQFSRPAWQQCLRIGHAHQTQPSRFRPRARPSRPQRNMATAARQSPVAPPNPVPPVQSRVKQPCMAATANRQPENARRASRLDMAA